MDKRNGSLRHRGLTLIFIIAALVLLVAACSGGKPIGNMPKSTMDAVATPTAEPTPTPTPKPTPTPSPTPTPTPMSIALGERAQERAAQLEPDVAAAKKSIYKSRTMLEEANEAYLAGEYEKAVEGYDKLLEKYPAQFGALNNRALAMMQLNKYEDALMEYMALSVAYPEQHGALINMLVAGHALNYDVDEMLAYHFGLDFSVDSKGDDSAERATMLLEARYFALDSLEQLAAEQKEVYEGVRNAVLYNIAYADMEKFNGDIDKSEIDRTLLPEISQMLSTLMEKTEGKDEDVVKLNAYFEALVAKNKLEW